MRKQKDLRKLKVYSQSGYNYKDTPTIQLKGQWFGKHSECCKEEYPVEYIDALVVGGLEETTVYTGIFGS